MTNKTQTNEANTNEVLTNEAVINEEYTTIEKMKSAIEQLEFKVAYQEDNFDQLNEIVTNQQFVIDKQAHLLKALVDKIKTIQTTTSEPDQDNDLPPHY